MQALVSFVGHSEENVLRSIHTSGHKFVFLVREHLVLVAVAATTESVVQLQLQLNYVYSQILSVLTYSQLERVFRQRVNYDLRRLLTGTEKFIDSLLNMIDSDPSFSLGAVRCLPLASAHRDVIAQTIVQCCKVKDLVFAILVAKNQLVSLVHMKKYFLHPQDLHLVINLVSASDSFKTAESWMPICLPKFDASGFLHAYVSYLDESCTSCLLLLTVNNDHFFQLSSCKQQIEELARLFGHNLQQAVNEMCPLLLHPELLIMMTFCPSALCKRLNRHGCLQAISESVARGSYAVSETGISELRHFAYKSRSSAQYTSPDVETPYATAPQRERLYDMYLQVASRLHSNSRPLKIYYLVADHETVLGWVTSGFELYAVFSPLVTKHFAIIAVNKLLKWIKREEDRLFILASPTF